MAPRKNNDKKQTVDKKKRTLKASKSGVKKAKLKPKSQGAVKLKIPVSGSTTLKKTMRKKTVAISKAKAPKVTKKQLTVQENIELANEVANTQLVKKEVPNETLEPEYVITITRAEPPLKGARKKKQCVENIVPVKVEQTDSEEAFEVTPKKRKYVRKAPPKVDQMKPKRSTKASTKSLVPAKNTQMNMKKNLKQTKLTDLSPSIISTPNKPKQTVKRAAQKKITNSTPSPRKRKLDTAIGKPGIETSSTDAQESPSLLEQVEYKLPKTDIVFESPKIASPVESRKTSTTGVSDCYSWTKDISSSSSVTCVSVSSNDFVRIDNRLPIIKITNVDYKLKTMQQEDSSSNSSCSCNSFTPRTPESSPEIDSHSLDLSTSSVTSPKRPTSPPTTCQSIEQNNQTPLSPLSRKDVILEKLSKKLKNVDLEIINWIGYDNDISQIPDNIAKLQERTIKLFQHESDVIFYCQCIKQTLNPKQNEENVSKEGQNESSYSVPVNTHRSEPLNEESVESNKDDYQSNDNIPRDKNVPLHRPVISNKIYENKFNFDRVKHVTDDLSYDDDDTLSLFAESITGMESSKMDITETNSDNILIDPLEEYIPQPITKDKWKSPNNINYVPSRITKDNMQSTDIKKTVCEKQNADSTSLSKDIEQMKNYKPVTAVRGQIIVQKDVTGNSSQYKTWMDSETKSTPRLMSSLYKTLPGVKSVVFRGICFYNMISGCKNPVCRFPHVSPEHDEIAIKLVRLSEEFFIQEYMLLRNWPVLRRKYGMVFVEECKRRDLTRYLVEMAIDFHIKANEKYREDAILKVEVAEYVLMHLNTVDLNSCEDLLLYGLQKDYLLCDLFMQTIADTQNFSRFKRVFINLTNFMTRHTRKFALNVATHMLERLCLLPSEQALSEALLTILENTDIAIFENSMMSKFEKQLLDLNKDLYGRFKALKKRYENGPVIKSLMDITPCPNPEPEVAIKQLVHNDRGKRYTSPDTTNLDNMNKALDDIIVHRTVDLSKLNIQRTSTNSSHSSDSNEESKSQCVAKPPPSYRSWKGQSVFDKIRGLSPVNQPRHFPGPKSSRHIYQRILGSSPPNFPRRFGPDF